MGKPHQGQSGYAALEIPKDKAKNLALYIYALHIQNPQSSGRYHGLSCSDCAAFRIGSGLCTGFTAVQVGAVALACLTSAVYSRASGWTPCVDMTSISEFAANIYLKLLD
jgi:hypothetical protein